MNMKAIVAAAVIAVGLPVSAFAANTAVAPKVQNTANSASASGSLASTTDFDAFMTGMGSADYTSATTGLSTATSFKVIKLSSLKNANAGKFSSWLTTHKKDMSGLETTISANAKAKAALDAQKLKASNVVWVDKSPDGTVNIFVDDLSKG